MSNGLGPDQDRHFVRPDLGPNCLQTTKITPYKEIVLDCYYIHIPTIYDTFALCHSLVEPSLQSHSRLEEFNPKLRLRSPLDSCENMYMSK